MPITSGRRVGELRLFAVLDLAGLALGFTLLTLAVILVMRRNWLKSLRAAITEAGRPVSKLDFERPDLPVNNEINALLAELRMERKFVEGIHVKWSPETLHLLLHEELPDAQVLIVSNREPYIHNWVDGEIRLQIPASGLVSALEPVMRACGGMWIAHGGGTADREASDANDRLQVPPDPPPIRCAASGSATRSRTAIITASPTRGCGRSAISPSCGPHSANRTGPFTRRSISASRMSWSRRRIAKIPSCWCRITPINPPRHDGIFAIRLLDHDIREALIDLLVERRGTARRSGAAAKERGGRAPRWRGRDRPPSCSSSLSQTRREIRRNLQASELPESTCHGQARARAAAAPVTQTEPSRARGFSTDGHRSRVRM